MRILNVALLAGLFVAGAQAGAQRGAPSKPKTDTTQQIEIYGFGQADMISDFTVNDPNWFDVNRPSKLPAFTDEFGKNTWTWASVRQSRFGVSGIRPTDHGDVSAHFEFDMFGVGPDARQTTLPLRLAYGQWGKFGAGLLPSPFMDTDIFPNIIEYWGPDGMLFYRNVQVFWQPINHDNTRFTLALERPGASGDAGSFADRIEIQNVRARFPAPDISAEYRLGEKWGYVELAGIIRWIRWDDLLTDTLHLGGGTTAGGASLSSNLKASKHDVIRLQAVYGAGVENYFNDAPVDVGIQTNFGDRERPVVGKALPDLGLVGYLDHTWNPQWSSALGWSMVNIHNSDGQLPTAFHVGQYASVNALWTAPVPRVMMGAEFQWGYRRNFSDDFTFNDYRLQFSFKYSFSRKWGGKDNDE